MLDDRIKPVQSKGKPRPYIRERGFDGLMSEREQKIAEHEEKLCDLREQLDALERKEAAQNVRPRVAAEIRVVSRQELSGFPTYSR